ncbi:MAG TPA: M36 family metallopeptidase [Albitalea sp.]|uniref:M36 family metallopeptidase n=1 Tax=Piscinibacter sp. TaxID=1903157 RepID=UPI002ED5B7AD
MSSIRRFTATAGAVAMLAFAAGASAAQDASAFAQSRAQVHRAASGRGLTGPSQAAHGSIVQSYLRGRGAAEATVASLHETQSRAAPGGVTHLRMEQQVDGLTVHGSYVKAAINGRGELVQLIEKVAPAGTPKAATVSESQALAAAMQRLHPGAAASFGAGARGGNTTRFAGDAFFHSDPSVTRVAVPMGDGTLAVGFLVETWTRKDNQLHHTLVGGDGAVLSVEKRTARDSYFVFQVDPSKGGQTTVSGPAPVSPAGTTPSPAGWLGSGSQKTVLISGNNVSGYLDTDKNNQPDKGGSAVTGGAFVTAWTPTQSPSTDSNKAVAVQNLFYLNNVVHDKLYTKGFTEAAGNFQIDNFGRGGSGTDPVMAEAQDGSGTDNANFATPPDGRSPRMQMYLWTGAGQTHEVQVNSPVAARYAAAGAEFGPALNSTGLTGNVVLVNDGVGTTSDACEPIATNLRGLVALADRGSCTFIQKAQNAQRAGAIGLIVANNVTGGVFTMGGSTQIRIPAVMISLEDGAALRGLSSPNATMRKLAVQPLQIDASLDSDVVFHEYGHGLTWRMIGGMDGPLAGAIGEGASDGVAMFINGDDVIGEYSASNPLGIRRARYAGYPLGYGDVTGAEVHDDGEIYAAIVWRMIELFGTRRETLFGYWVDGMNYTPSTPAYEDMRDGVLQAIANSTGSTKDCGLVWRAFAQFGVGQGAQGVVNGATVTITPSNVDPGNTCSVN